MQCALCHCAPEQICCDLGESRLMLLLCVRLKRETEKEMRGERKKPPTARIYFHINEARCCKNALNAIYWNWVHWHEICRLLQMKVELLEYICASIIKC